MITSGIGYIVLLLMVTSLVMLAENKAKLKLFKWAPSFVIIYLVVMLLTPLNLWQWNDATQATYKLTKSFVLPAMIFLMLLNANIKVLAKLGVKLIFTFLLASLSIALGIIATHAVFSQWLPENSWMTFAALTGSWMGGTANMMAVQSALNIPNDVLGYTLIMDSVDYGLWVMLLLFLVPFANRFNQWSKANVSALDEFLDNSDDSTKDTPYQVTDHLVLITLALGVAWFSHSVAPSIPDIGLLGQSAWVVIIATVVGLIAAQTPLRNLNGKEQIASQLLILMIALIASRADLASMSQAPMFVLAGLIILFIHGVAMLVFAKLFKLDLFSCGIASLANIGGIASAPILAGAYSKALIPVGVLMAILGYVVGTFGGLTVAHILGG